MPFDADRLAELLAARREPALRLALLFGSRASGRAGADSDVDLAVLADRPLDAAERESLREATMEAFGVPLDLVDLYRAPYPVTGEALGGRRLLGDDERFAALAVRHLVDREDFGPLHDRLIGERLDAWLRTSS